ncbi:potassium channel family protein [Aquiflexum gelatinilyticum]|uniref:Potassium channel family protein n=1 Tax=Aquiflexum gelatinilyticum TaxID=2961943 RepID=A0A9X2T4T2_9BACT|nr:potassium channel family protein [Aquiflexum gelatinilyticum]MCR9017480.1 potassium channel family protein [Aquiflexum gelatinilyticum]MCS4434656.1 potassium channel family protein [Aquiflexum gelatinilyticum]
MKGILQKSKRYWESDASFITLLVMLLFTVFFLPILIHHKEDSTYFLNTMFIMLFVIGMFSARERLFFTIAATLVVIHLVLRMIRFSDNPYEFYFEERIVILLNLLVFSIINFRLLFRNSEVNLYRVIGAINVYLLVALMGSFGFELMQLSNGNAISGDMTFEGRDRDFGNYIYFSLVSVTTVGFGDMLPVSIGAKMLSVFLSTFGILYPAVVIAKLVSSSPQREKVL